MKDVSEEYEAKEQATKIKPTELFHIWRDGGEHWRYTNGDVAVDYGVDTYFPATLKRGTVKWNSQLEVSTLKIQIGYLEDPALEFIAMNPIEILWISVMRLHRDLPTEVDVVFVGQIRNVSFKGILANVDCVGFEHFLQMPIPTFRYQLNCNWKLFETKTIGMITLGCQLVKLTYRVTAIITLDVTKKILTSATFGGYTNGYFKVGSIEFGSEKRGVIAHVGNNVTMAYPMRDLESGDSVYAYPGCDGRIETCRDKFDNVVNHFGFPIDLEENPTLRTP